MHNWQTLSCALQRKQHKTSRIGKCIAGKMRILAVPSVCKRELLKALCVRDWSPRDGDAILYSRQLEKETARERGASMWSPVFRGARERTWGVGIGYTCPIYGGILQTRSGPPPDPDSQYSYIGSQRAREIFLHVLATFARESVTR